MVGFLAAATPAPMTSLIIVMQMVDGHGLVLSLMACALIASAISRTLSAPLYGALSLMQLQRLPTQPLLTQIAATVADDKPALSEASQ